MTSPDPVPPPFEPFAATVTTEGMTFSATEVTGQALTVDDDPEVLELTLEPDDLVALTMRPPTTPPTTSAVPSATHSSHPRGLNACLDSLTTAPYPGLEGPAATQKGTSRSNCHTGVQDHPVDMPAPAGMSNRRLRRPGDCPIAKDSPARLAAAPLAGTASPDLRTAQTG